MRYAGGRPLWHLSLVYWRNRKPAALSSLDSLTWRKLEAMRDRIMVGVGTNEDWVIEHGGVAVNYRRPLRLDEVNQMAPDDAHVRARQGRS